MPAYNLQPVQSFASFDFSFQRYLPLTAEKGNSQFDNHDEKMNSGFEVFHIFQHLFLLPIKKLSQDT